MNWAWSQNSVLTIEVHLLFKGKFLNVRELSTVKTLQIRALNHREYEGALQSQLGRGPRWHGSGPSSPFRSGLSMLWTLGTMGCLAYKHIRDQKAFSGSYLS